MNDTSHQPVRLPREQNVEHFNAALREMRAKFDGTENPPLAPHDLHRWVSWLTEVEWHLNNGVAVGAAVAAYQGWRDAMGSQVGSGVAARHDCQEWREAIVGCAVCHEDYYRALDNAEAHGKSGVAARIDAAEKAILAAADALRDNDPNEAYHRLYGYVDPAYTETGDPFAKLRAAVSAGGGTEPE